MTKNKHFSLWARQTRLTTLVLSLCCTVSSAELVINEVMFHPFEPWPPAQPFRATNRTEFVEIYNAGATTASLLDYRFDNGISFNFTPGTTLAPGEYLVISENLETFTNAYPAVTNVVGNFGGNLNNAGERITLSRFDGTNWVTADTLEYIDDEIADGTGRSLELVNPGFARLRDQFYGDWYSSLTLSGTPGLVNSVFDPTPPPVAGDVNHDPPLPPPASIVTITARITGRDGDNGITANLLYRKNADPPLPWKNEPMVDNEERGDVLAHDGIYTVEVPTIDDPPFIDGDVMEFRIDVSDNYGSQTFPATNRAGVFAGPWSYFCKFGEDPESDVAHRGEYRTFHLLMTEIDRLAFQTNIYSLMPAGGLGECTLLFDTTLVTSDGQIFYNSALRCRGGSSKHYNFGGYRVNLPEGRSLDDKARFNLNYVQALDQFIGMTIFERTTPGFSLDVDLARVWINSDYKNPPTGSYPAPPTSESFTVSGQGIYVMLEPFNDSSIRKRYPPGEIGNRYSADGDHRTGHLQYIGDNPAQYFNLYFINENNPYTAWNEIVDFSRILSQDATNFPATLTNRMNIRHWARHMATQVCIDNGEAGFATPGSGGGDELRLYVDATDGQFDIFPWDMDSIIGTGAKIWDYGTSGSQGGDIISNFLYNDPMYPYYVGDVYDIITTTMSQQDMTELFDSMGSKMNPYKASYLNTINTQRQNLLNTEFNSTNLAINGHSPGSPFVILEPEVTEFPVRSIISQIATPPQWVFLATNTFRAQGDDFVRLTSLKSGRSGTVADAMLFSNAIAGATIVDNDDPGFFVSTNPAWEGFFATGGYTNGSYLRTNFENRTAIWKPSLPTNGIYDVYAWLNPGTLPTTNAIYDITAVHIDFGLPSNGVAPQNYTARVTQDGTNMLWNQRNGKWASPGSVRMNRGVRHTTLQAVDSEGAVLESIDVLAVANLFPQSVEGLITSDTTWNAHDRIFSISNDVTVASGVRLSVGPGTVVLIEPGSTLTVNGNLEIVGEPDDPAYFMPRSNGADWLVQLINANGSMTVSNAHLIGGRISISGGSSLQIEDSTIEYSQHPNGIVSSTGGSHVHLRRSIVKDFAKTHFDSSPTVVEECLFENMSATGIELSGSAPTSTVRRTTFRVTDVTEADAVLFDSTSVGLIDNCLFEWIPGTGVHIDNATASILYSVFEGCDTGIEATGASSVNNVNNTITKGSVGIDGEQSINNAIMWSLYTSVVGGPSTIAYSDIELSGTNIYAGTANINRNPWFRDENASDYRLQLISPARGGGLGSENMGASFPAGANPATPENLTLIPDTNAIYLAWQDNSADEESAFNIERSLDGIDWASIATVGANITNYWDFGLSQNTEYHYRVRAVHNRGHSFYSDPDSRITGIEDETQMLIDNLRITEFMYNLPGPDDGEFMEFKNISQTKTLALGGLVTDPAPGEPINRFVFPNGTMLSPQSFFVLVRNPAAFAATHPGVPIDGAYHCDMGCGLDNGGETLWVQDAASNDIIRFTYEGGENDPNWYPTTDGNGHSMVPVDPNPITGAPNLPVFWRASANVGGSPGADDPNPGIGTVLINELLAHQDLPSGDVLELYNAGSSAVDIGGWFLSDNENSLRKYSFPPGTIIGASNYLLRTENSHFGMVPAGTNGFAFSELGEEIILSSGSGGSLTSYRTLERFGATENNVSLGRHTRSDGEVDFVSMNAQTLLAANSLPSVGPVVINEIMYNPASGGKEYIELLNTSPFPVPLYDVVHPTNTWEFDGAMEYTFPTGVTMAAGEHLLVVSVQPDEFRQLFGLSNSPVRVYGPFSGNLNNAGESVKLYYPGQPEPGGFVPRIRTDRVSYGDDLPWPTSADNEGPSLERKVALDYGNDPANWVAASVGGTPGIANNTGGLPSVGFPDIRSSVIESNDTIVISMTLLPQVTSTVTVQYAVSGGTATRDSDYTFEDGTLIFWPYDTRHTIPLSILDDLSPSGEPDETIEISITGVSTDADIGGNAVYTHSIIDDDAISLAAPTITPSVDMTFTNALIISMAPGVANSDIYYTIDGSRPTRDDILYENPFILATSARVTARTFLGSASDGDWTSVLFTEQPFEYDAVGPPGQAALFVTVNSTQPNQIVIMWTGDPADTYAIYRSTNLLVDTPGEVILNAIPGHPSGTNTYTDNGGIWPAAYYTIGTDTP